MRRISLALIAVLSLAIVSCNSEEKKVEEAFMAYWEAGGSHHGATADVQSVTDETEAFTATIIPGMIDTVKSTVKTTIAKLQDVKTKHLANKPNIDPELTHLHFLISNWEYSQNRIEEVEKRCVTRGAEIDENLDAISEIISKLPAPAFKCYLLKTKQSLLGMSVAVPVYAIAIHDSENYEFLRKEGVTIFNVFSKLENLPAEYSEIVKKAAAADSIYKQFTVDSESILKNFLE